MANVITKSYKQELFTGTHEMTVDTLRFALYTSASTIDADTTVYTTTNEVTGTGYTAGGKQALNTTVTISGTKAIFDCDDITWEDSTITARKTLLYNSTKSNRAIGIWDFGQDRTSDNGPFVLRMPVADSLNALLRLA